MTRLKPKDLKDYREQQWKKQNGRCCLCQEYIEPTQAVLDHNHKTGANRGVLHRMCNLFLSRIENNQRYSLTQKQIESILGNALAYIRQDLGTLHTTYRTPEEKRERALKRARTRRIQSKLNKI